MPRSVQPSSFVLVLTCCGIAALAGCSGNKSSSTAAAPSAVTAPAAASGAAASSVAAAPAGFSVNRVCVIENDEAVNPNIKPVVWKGQNVGFCCAGCKAKFNQMTDIERTAAVTKAVAASTPAK